MSQISLDQLTLGLDCVMKMKHARDRRPRWSHVEHAENAELVKSLYWSCHPADFERPRSGVGDGIDWTRSVLNQAVEEASRTGMPRRIRGPVLVSEGMLVSADEVVVRSDGVEVTDITPKLSRGFDGLLTMRGAVRAEWAKDIIGLAIKRMILERQLAALAAGRPVTASLVLLRSGTESGADADGLRRTLDDFRLLHRPPERESGSTVDARDLVTRPGGPAEGAATFVRLDASTVVETLEIMKRTADLDHRIGELRRMAETDSWPDPRSCLSVKCQSCEFRENRGSGEPSGLERCWGSDFSDQPHHILNLDFLSEKQLATALKLAGPEATIRVLPEEDVSPRQRAQYVEARTQVPLIERGLGELLAHDGMPARFLNITAIGCPVPIFRGMAPYELFPFQFSAYELDPSRTALTHRRLLPGFLHEGAGDSRLSFVRALRQQLGEAGPVYVWSNYERAIIKIVRTALRSNGTIVGGDADDDFLAMLTGDPIRSGGRMVDLHFIARKMGMGNSLALITTTAWRLPAVRAAFGPGHGAAGDPRIYQDEVDPARDVPSLAAEFWGHLASDDVDDLELQAMGPQRLFIRARLFGRSDDPAVLGVMAAQGDYKAMSVLLAHRLLSDIARRPTDRNVRIFISSTFRDFRAERDILKRKVEPELQRRASDRSVSISVVDLRWGITDEQTKAGMILPICLQEIARCHPYFVGLLGERYGWVPGESAFPPMLSERMPWLREHAGGASVTELEIRHGALQAGAQGGDASFYFRAPGYALGRGEDFESAGEPERQRLSDLKKAIRDGGFLVREDYRDPEEFGRLVTDDLWRRIDATFPGEVVGPAARADIAVHDAWAWSLADRYRPYHEAAVREIDSAIRAHAGRILILGAPGIGKSSLLAAALRGFGNSMDYLLVRHFVGVGTTPATADALAARVIGALARAVGAPVPSDPTSRTTLVELADRIRRERWHPVIAIDGLDAVQEASRIEWIWEAPLRHATVVLTGMPGGRVEARFATDVATRTVRMETISAAQRTDLVQHLLAQHGRTLRDEEVAAIAGHSAAAHPGFITAVVNELLVCDSFEKLPVWLRDCIAARDLTGLYNVILRRLDSEMPDGSVARAMRALLAATGGVREPDLVARLDGQQAEWSFLRLHLGEPIIDSGGLISIRPGPFADAARARYGDRPTG
ncbi:MAG: DUF2779 domain-containing protein [Candidatus Hydrogenedentes bacterium]|nr:DUF2779 domain-containing protein [Candidatus Hydrogenedentota bacterium]